MTTKRPDKYYIDEENFKKYEYHRSDLSRLQYATSYLGLPQYDNKLVQYSKISQFLELREELLKEQEIKNMNLDQFSKPFPPLSITNTIDKKEFLFWEIFRNKYLFYKIFNNFIYKKLYPYNKHSDVKSIYVHYNNANEIIKDKVKSSKSLSFGLYDVNSPFCGLLSIFENIPIGSKDHGNIRKKHQMFYQKLFKNYSPNFEEHKSIVNIIFGSGSFTIFQEYMKYLKLSSIDIKKFLIDYFDSNTTFVIGKYKHFKLFNQLQLKYRLPVLDVCEFKEFKIFKDYEKRINCNNRIVLNFDFSPFKLKQFLKIITIIKSNPVFSQFCSITRFKESLEEFELFKQQFTVDQLNFTIYEILTDLTKYYENKNQSLKNKQLKKSLYRLFKIYFKLFEKNSIGKGELYFKEYEKIKESLNVEVKLKNIKYFINQFKNNQEKIEFLKPLTKSIQNKKILEEIIKDNDLKLLDDFFQNFSFFQLFHFNFSFFQLIKSKETLDHLFSNKKYQDTFYSDRNTHWQLLPSMELLEHFENQMISLGRRLLVDVNHFKYQEDILTLKLLINAVSSNKTINMVDESNPAIKKPTIKLYEIRKDIKIMEYSKIIQKAMQFGEQQLIIELLETGLFKIIKGNSLFAPNSMHLPPRYSEYPKQLLSSWILSNCISKLPYLELPPFNEMLEVEYQLEGESEELELELKNNITFKVSQKQLVSMLSSIGRFKEGFSLLKNGDQDEGFSCIFFLQFSKYSQLFLQHYIEYYLNYFNKYQVNLKDSNNDQMEKSFNKSIYSLFEDICKNGDIVILKFLILNYPSIIRSSLLENSQTEYSQFIIIHLLNKLFMFGNFKMVRLFSIFIKIDKIEINKIKTNNIFVHPKTIEYLNKFNK